MRHPVDSVEHLEVQSVRSIKPAYDRALANAKRGNKAAPLYPLPSEVAEVAQYAALPDGVGLDKWAVSA